MKNTISEEMKMYSITETARKTGLSKDFIRTLIKNREIEVFNTGGKFFIPVSSIENYLNEHMTKSKREN